MQIHTHAKIRTKQHTILHQMIFCLLQVWLWPSLTLLHSKRPKLHEVLAILSAIGLTLLHSERSKLHTILAFLSATGLILSALFWDLFHLKILVDQISCGLGYGHRTTFNKQLFRPSVVDQTGITVHVHAKHYKHNADGRTAPGVCGNGSLPPSHSGNVVTRIGIHTHTH